VLARLTCLLAPCITPKSQLSKNAETKRRTKTARQNNWLTQRPQSARTQTSFSPKASKGSIAFGTQKSPAHHCHHISFILAAAHFKSVNIRKRIARLFGRIVIVSQNYCAIFVAFAQRIGHLSSKYRLMADIADNARPSRGQKVQ
jgi:hypothetical protein